MAGPAAIRPSMGAALNCCRAAASSASANSLMCPLPLMLSARRAVVAPPSLRHTAGLSTTAALLKRHKYAGARDTRDNNKTRGESALRRTGTRWRLSMSDEPLPKPVSAEELPPVETDPDHGLWDFFPDRLTVANSPENDAKHGRGWMVEELRAKSWDDLHRLWWVCVKERNRIATATWERKKSNLGFGDAEATKRDNQVKITMRGIKHVLTERQYAWEDAVKLAETDPEIDLSGNGPVFVPAEYLEPESEAYESAEEQQATEAGEEAVGEAAPEQTEKMEKAEKVEPVSAAPTTPEPSTSPTLEPKAQGEGPKL